MIGFIKRTLRKWALKAEMSAAEERKKMDTLLYPQSPEPLRVGFEQDPIIIRIWDAQGGSVIQCKMPVAGDYNLLAKQPTSVSQATLHIVPPHESISEAVERIIIFERLKQ